MELWWCIDCRVRVELNRHGRCQLCDSDAVDTMERAGTRRAVASILIPVAESVERLTVHLETTLRWESEGEFASAGEESVFEYQERR
jgi:hypothetical protein